MMLKKFAFLLPALLAAYSFCHAQYQGKVFTEDTTVKLIVNGNEQTMAWCGGVDNPMFAMGDLNNDGKADLVIYERANHSVKTFINQGTTGSPKYVYAPRYAKNFSDTLNEYLTLADYNCDNIPDLFYRGYWGYAVAKGSYNAANELQFKWYRDLWYYNDLDATPPCNAYVNPYDIAGIVDVDNDGDLDFISYGNNNGSLLLYHQNLRVEQNLPCDSIKIRLADKAWGRVLQNTERTHTLGFMPDNSSLQKGTKTTHTGNTPCLFDADGDGDYDYLDGNIQYDDLVFLRNNKAQFGGVDSMVYQDTAWQSGGTKVSLPQWPAAFWIDIDQDGKKDIVVAPHAEGTSENYKCVWYYRNTGTQSNPAYTYQKDTMFIDQMIDHGSSAFPFLYDYNKDGKPDLFIGSGGYYQAGGSFKSRLAYYQNTTANGIASFTRITDNFLNTGAQNWRGTAPAIGDIDNDGKDDLLLGHYDGTISFYKNMAVSQNDQPIWQLTQSQLMNDTGGVINVGGRAMPVIYDMNKDGRKDLVSGCLDGNLYYYQNTGTTGLELQYKTDTLGNVKIQFFAGKSTPFIGKMDNSGIDYLLSGSDVGWLFRFDGFQNGNVSTPYTQIDDKYSLFNAGNNTAPTVGDIDGDGKYEMIVGNTKGGVRLYRQRLEVAGIPKQEGADNRFELFPNPATREVYAGIKDQELQEGAIVYVYNSMGQLMTHKIKSGSASRIAIDIRSLPAGVYVCRMNNGATVYSGIFVKD